MPCGSHTQGTFTRPRLNLGCIASAQEQPRRCISHRFLGQTPVHTLQKSNPIPMSRAEKVHHVGVDGSR